MIVTMPDDQIHSLNEAIARLRSELAEAREAERLVSELARRGWRLDRQLDGHGYRVMFYCTDCGGRWLTANRPGEWYDDPLEAIEQAIKEDSR